ncbi:MAG: hypothetical protein RL172_1783 [Bacteroidota bacterium]|jgi:hypothetical protein
MMKFSTVLILYDFYVIVKIQHAVFKSPLKSQFAFIVYKVPINKLLR